MKTLRTLLDKYQLYPEKVIFSKLGCGWFATDHDKIVEIDASDCGVLENFNSDTIIVYESGDYLDIYVEMAVEERPVLQLGRIAVGTVEDLKEGVNQN